MAGQKLVNKEIDKRVVIKLDKSIKNIDNGYNGIMSFGQDNDYPQVIEKLILGSSTAKSAANIYARFLTGRGFKNQAINNIVVGKDERGKKITVLSLLRQVAMSCAFHNGYYIHCNRNMLGDIKNVHLKAFKNCRFSKPDDTGYSAKILYYDNWEKDKDTGKYDKDSIVPYHTFSDAYEAQIKAVDGAENYNGQLYFNFLDNQFFYPLSPFDSVYLDCDTENQIALFKNRQIRDGFFNKVVIRVAPVGTSEERAEFVDGLVDKLGPDGDPVIVMEDDVDEAGEITDASAFKIDTVVTNVDPKLFDGWEKSLSNSIRKAPSNIPAILIDYEESKLGTTSGEAITQAVNFYNALTRDARAEIEQSFAEIFKHSTNETLKNNKDWEIEPLNLIEEEKEAQVDEAEVKRLESQANLKGSVGGVTALITLQQSVAAGTSDLDAAVEIVKEIYGISEEIARKMIGTPKKITEEGGDNGTN